MSQSQGDSVRLRQNVTKCINGHGGSATVSQIWTWAALKRMKGITYSFLKQHFDVDGSRVALAPPPTVIGDSGEPLLSSSMLANVSGDRVCDRGASSSSHSEATVRRQLEEFLRREGCRVSLHRVAEWAEVNRVEGVTTSFLEQYFDVYVALPERSGSCTKAAEPVIGGSEQPSGRPMPVDPAHGRGMKRSFRNISAHFKPHAKHDALEKTKPKAKRTLIIKCCNCGLPGHFAKTCTHPAKGFQGSAVEWEALESGERRRLLQAVPRPLQLTRSQKVKDGKFLIWLGSKYDARDKISNVIPAGVKIIVSPFFGGGSAELHLLRTNQSLSIQAYDADRALVNFWQQLLRNPEEVAWRCEALLRHGVSKQEFESHRDQLFGRDFITGPDAAAAYFMINRIAFGGMMTANYVKANAAKAKRRAAAHARNIKSFMPPSNLQVECADVFDVIGLASPEALLFLDPPYWTSTSTGGASKKKTLVREQAGLPQKSWQYACGSNWGRQQHERLHGALALRARWVLCHADCEEIRNLYHGCRILHYNVRGMFKNQPDRKELLILSPWVAEHVGCPAGLSELE